MSCDILLNLIDPDPGQPRQNFDEAKTVELAQSMEANGLAVPIAVRPAGDRFIIIHGERRWRAARSLGWEVIRAEVCNVSLAEARWLSLVENVQRADLSPIEEARAYKARLDEGITQVKLGERVGKSQSYIAQKLRLLKLPDPLVFYLDRGAITEGHARQLMKLKALYAGVQTEFNSELGESETLSPEKNGDIESWCQAVGPIMRDIRPEDNPICWFAGGASSDDSAWLTLAEGCRLFIKYVVDNGGKVPQWTVASFWWGSLVVYLGLSVARLSKSLGNWEKRFLTAIWWVHHNGEKEPATKLVEKMTVKERLYDLMWWGYHSDVRHSSARELISLPSEIMERIAYQHIVGGPPGASRGYILPSSCQPWGEQRQEYRELEDIETGGTR